MDCGLFDGQLSRQFAELGPYAANGGNRAIQSLLGLLTRQRQNSLLNAGARSDFERLPCASQRVAIVVHEMFDSEGEFNFAAAVEALSGAALVGLETGELGLPEAENIGFDAADAGDVADAEIKPVGDFSRGRMALLGGLCGHPILQRHFAHPLANAVDA